MQIPFLPSSLFKAPLRLSEGEKAYAPAAHHEEHEGITLLSSIRPCNRVVCAQFGPEPESRHKKAFAHFLRNEFT